MLLKMLWTNLSIKMGLLKFLKEKFSKKNKENIENSPIEKNDSVDTSNEVKKDDVDVLNTKKSEVNKNENKVFEEKQIKKYEDGLEKSRKSFALKLKSLSKKYKKVNKEYFDNLEEVLIEADVGVRLTLSVIDELIEKARKEKISDADEINEALIDILFQKYVQDNKDVDLEIKFKENSPTICLVVGVNGVGKTTSIAKLANWYKNKGKKVLIIAADTFRAAAQEQLDVWAKRINVDIVSGKNNSDPSSVLYDGLNKAKDNYDLVIIDTAGRLQNKVSLMNELSKMRRVISKLCEDSIVETFLVLDATTGQNGVSQAKSFFDATGLTGIIITKMDGTSKGGIILSIKNELGIPVRFIGLGEKIDDLQLFDLEKYLYGLCVVNDKDE